MQVHFQRANGYEDSDEDGDNFLRVMMMMMKMRNLISHRNEKRAVWLRVGDAFWVCPESDNYIAIMLEKHLQKLQLLKVRFWLV